MKPCTYPGCHRTDARAIVVNSALVDGRELCPAHRCAVKRYLDRPAGAQPVKARFWLLETALLVEKRRAA